MDGNEVQAAAGERGEVGITHLNLYVVFMYGCCVVHLGINIIIEELKHKIERLKGTESEIKCPNTRNHYIS